MAHTGRQIRYLFHFLYEEMTERIDTAAMSGKIPEEMKANHKGFHDWNHETTSKNHQPIVQVPFVPSKPEQSLHDSGVNNLHGVWEFLSSELLSFASF
jgi:hypothetical protein